MVLFSEVACFDILQTVIVTCCLSDMVSLMSA